MIIENLITRMNELEMELVELRRAVAELRDPNREIVPQPATASRAGTSASAPAKSATSTTTTTTTAAPAGKSNAK